MCKIAKISIYNRKEQTSGKMFEVRYLSSGVLKKVLHAIRDLIGEATFECSDAGIQVAVNSTILNWLYDRCCFRFEIVC